MKIETNRRSRIARGWMSLCLGAIALSMIAGCAWMCPKGDGLKGKLPEGGEVDLDRFFCLNAITPFHHKVSSDPEVQKDLWKELKRQLTLAKSLGASHIRVDMWWGIIEPEKGKYEWEFPDRVIDEILAAGLEPYPILCYNSAWTRDQSPATDEGREEFGDYVYNLVKRNKDKVDFWEVWNEPNIQPFWVPDPDAGLYTELLKVAYTRAKEADPDCTVVAFCTAGPDTRFIEGCYQNGAHGYLDAVSYHHYSDLKEEDILESEIRAIRGIMRRQGDGDKPLLITELGLSTGPSDIVQAETPEDQAVWMVKKHMMAVAGGVAQLYWFKMKDDKSESEPDGYWGLVMHDYKPKLSARAYKAMAARLKDARYVGSPNLIAKDTSRNADSKVLFFQSKDEILGCGWVKNDGKDLTVYIPVDSPVTIENMEGETIETVQPDTKGFAAIPLTKRPIYIRGLPLKAIPLAATRFNPSPVQIAPGETRNVLLTIENPLETSLSVRLSDLAKPPEGSHLTIKVPSMTVEAKPRTITHVPVQISLSPDSPPFVAREYVFTDAKSSYSFQLRVEYADPFEVRVRVRKEENEGRVTTLFTNRLDRPVSGKVQWIFGDKEPDSYEPFLNLQPGATAAIEKKLGYSMSVTNLVAKLVTDDGVQGEGNVRLYGQPLLKIAPVIDGDLKEWKGLPAAQLTPKEHQTRPLKPVMSEKDVSAAIQIAWTREALFLAAEVVDDVPLLNPHAGTELWKGDSLELYVGFGGPALTDSYSDHDFQIGIHPGDQGKNPIVWNWKPKSKNPPEGGMAIDGAVVATQKTNSGYRVEASIPLKALGESVAPFQILGFTVHLNDKDSADSLINDGVLIWQGTPMDWNDPSRWGVAVVIPKGE